MPSSKISGSMEGASSAYTLAGPPDRMMAGGGQRAHLVGGDVARHDLGVHVQIAHAAGDELPVLGPEIDDDDQLLALRSAHRCS